MTPEHQYRRIICAYCGYTVDVPIYCGNRFCSVCSSPRLKRVRLRLTSIIKQTPFIPGYDFKHLTLSIRNRQDLPGMITFLITSFKLLRRTIYWKHHVAGGAFVIEVSGQPLSWHAHLHIVIQCNWMKWEHLLAAWSHVSRGRGVYITRIPKGDIIRYLTKYLTKPSVAPVHVEVIADPLKSYRLFQTFGKWHTIKVLILKEPALCPKCKAAAWIPFDILYRGFTQPEHGRHPPRTRASPSPS